MGTTVAGIRHSICTQLRKNNYTYIFNRLISIAYIGEGFYINHKERVNVLSPVYGYDRNGAYMGSLKDHDFPLSSTLGIKETKLGIYKIAFTKMEPRYPEFHYTIFQNQIHRDPTDNFKKYLFLTNLDYEIFKDLYITDSVVFGKLYFQDIGHLGIDRQVDTYYKRKKQDDKNNKWVYEAGFYGMFAERLCKTHANKENYKQLIKKMRKKEREEFYEAMFQAGYKDREIDYIDALNELRSTQTPIAMFQAAYLRYEEWQLWKSLKNSVVYMNTDSIYCDKDFQMETSDEVGNNKKEYNGETIFWIRRNAYVVVDSQFNIKKAILGGLIEDHGLTPEKLKKMLFEHETVKANTYVIDKNKEKHKKEIELEPKFLNHNYLKGV